MTLLWFDGFEGTDITPYTTNYVGFNFSNAAATSMNYGLSCGNSSGSGSRYIDRAVTASSQLFVGGRFFIDAYSETLISLWGDSGATQHTTIQVNASGGIDIMRGPSTVVASSANNLVLPQVWFYVEVSATVADSGGVVDVRLNGGSTAVVSFTGDTKNAGTNTTLDHVRWYSFNSVTARFDDIYVCNSSGSNNTFRGDVQAYGHFPTAAGDNTGLTPSTGSNWQNVDEVTASATDYNGHATVTTRDLYNVTDLPTTTTVFGVRLNAHMLKSDAGAASMKAAIKSNTTTVYESTETLSTTMTAYNYAVRETDPATSAAWTSSGVNAVQIGAEVA